MERIREYLLNEEEILIDIVRGINAYNGSFETIIPYENDEYTINELFENNAYDFMERCQYGNYSIGDDYFTFDTLGHIYSCNWDDIVEETVYYIDEIIEELLSIWSELYINEELKELIEEYLKEEEEEEEE